MFEKFAEDVYKRYIEKMAVLDNPDTWGTAVSDSPDTQGTTVSPLRLREVDQLIPSEIIEQSASQPATQSASQPVTQSKNNNKPMGVAGKAQQTVGNVHNQIGNFYFNRAHQNQNTLENKIRNILNSIENKPYDAEAADFTNAMNKDTQKEFLRLNGF